MIEDLANTIVTGCVMLVVSLIGGLIGFYYYGEGQTDMIQELCTKQQYDFCEIVEHKPEYRLKRERNNVDLEN